MKHVLFQNSQISSDSAEEFDFFRLQSRFRKQRRVRDSTSLLQVVVVPRNSGREVSAAL